MTIYLENIQKISETYPFKYSTYKLFDDKLCFNLIENFKIIENQFKNIKGLSKSRIMITIEGDTLNGINYDKYEYIKDIEPLNSILNIYKDKISRKIYEKYNNIKKDIIKFNIKLVKDTKNYSIGPHTDSYRRNVTMLTYLVPEKNKNKKLGLSIFKDKINRHKDNWYKTHYSFENFEKIKQIDYYNGSTIDFKVCNNSFHGVENTEYGNRYSIQLVILN